MLVIKVLGSGCENCRRLAWLTERVINHLGIEAQIVKVTDYAEMMQYNIMSTPGLVINEKLVNAGKIPTEAQITTWIASALEIA
jgi:small redox-active disulfide protein 2